MNQASRKNAKLTIVTQEDTRPDLDDRWQRED